MKEYEIVVGLETHVELATETKIFCGCKNAFGSEVNANCCPVCAGLPGALPTLNEKVIAYAIKMGFATNCSINPVSKMDRKNYFYPDLPKAYQISQFDVPVCENGYVDVILNEQGDTKRINLERIHIEEDAGKLIHDDAFDGTLVDLNRSGVPLIEIVTRPDFRSGAEAKAYLTTLKSILGYIGVSDCKMQEGSIRCDVNLSVREKGSEKFGTRTEMKNISTFSGVERAIDYEAKRQIAIIENGGSLKLETRKWDDAKGENSLLRIKENEPDYRCFPEPDLMTIVVEKQTIDEIRASLPELPNAKMTRYIKEYDLPYYDANLIVESMDRSAFFEECVAMNKCQPKNISNWILGDISRILNEKKLLITETKLTAQKLVEMVELIEKNTISNAAGKVVIEEIVATDKTANDVVKEKSLAQISDDSALLDIVKNVLAGNEKAVADYKNGKTNVAGFLVGLCMKETKGKGNPAKLRELLVGEIEK
ncbi:MAG: Asp-tRNA(Asn)/Glu-tRNA(Gln) amidotransferase subunit GatB [Oscillospiraceae bacterium]